MNILIFTLGSRGDVQPYLALAVGLQQAGHRVTLATSREFTPLIEAHGVGVYPLRFSLQAFMQQPENQAVLRGRNIFRQLRLLRVDIHAGMLQVLADFWEAAQTVDYVVASSFGYNGVEVAGQRQRPLAYAFLAPFAPATRAFPSFLLPLRFSLGGGYNYLTYTLMLRAMWPTISGPLNAWRAAQLGLPPWRSIDQMLGAQRGQDTDERALDRRPGLVVAHADRRAGGPGGLRGSGGLRRLRRLRHCSAARLRHDRIRRGDAMRG